MAFIEDDFSPVGGQPGSTDTSQTGEGQGIAEYSYGTTDPLPEVTTDGYFNELRDQLTRNNIIHVSAKLNELDNDARQYALVYIDSVDKSPSTANVTVSSLIIDLPSA